MKNNLLTALRKYRPREGKDPLENFITEAFAWILKNHDSFAGFFLTQLEERLQVSWITASPTWHTQVNFDGFFPDMLCKIGSNAFVFEHKARAFLYQGQLDNYRSYARDNFEEYKVILITGDSSQHEQEPDLALCWREIHTYITGWLSIEGDSVGSAFIFYSFLELLESEGFGPAAPVSHESILYFSRSRHFRTNVQQLIDRLFAKEENFFRSHAGAEMILLKRFSWGRLGLELFQPWSPGLFVGVLGDWEDHAVRPLLAEDSPDFVFILSFHLSHHNLYPTDADFLAFIHELEANVRILGRGWEFYNHLEDDAVANKNDYHPIYVRKPLIEVLRGTKTAEEQEDKFKECAKEILPLFTQNKRFHALQAKYKAPISEELPETSRVGELQSE